MKIYGVDEEPAGQISEGGVAYETGDQGLERLAAIQGRRQEPPECDVCPCHLEHIPPAHQAGSGIHLLDRYASCPRGTYEGPDARADDQAGNQPPLLESPEHTDVGEPF